MGASRDIEKDLVLGIDSSTQSTKVVAWDRLGREAGQGRAPIAMQHPAPTWFEQTPDGWRQSLWQALAQLWQQVDARRVAALSIANQRETLAFLDRDGRSVRPAMVWLDERAMPYLAQLGERLGGQRIHQITGRPVDITPSLYRVAWLRDHEPANFAATATFADVQTELALQLTGRRCNSRASADSSSMFDIHDMQWSQPILAELGLGTERFPPALPCGTLMGTVTRQAAAESGLVAGTPLFAGAGDGQCAGLATGCTAPGQAYVNLGTAIVSGLWSPVASMSRDWRTLVAASGSGYVLETVQRTGALLINWFVDNFTGLTGQGEHIPALSEVEAAASRLPIGSEGLLLLPYWSGCLNPHWDSGAKGCLVGLGNAHTRAHIYRAVLEGLTMETARSALAMVHAGVEIDRFVAIGGGARSELWVRMLADATGRPVGVNDGCEASALGAGMIAACGAGWYPSIADAVRGMASTPSYVQPDPRRTERYAGLMAVHATLYDRNATVFRALDAFRQGAASTL